MTNRRFVFATAVGLALVGVVAYPAVTTILGVGGISHSEIVNGPAQVTARHFISTPGEVGGWHYHPGYVFNVVTRGTVVVEDGCGEEQAFNAGEAFEKIDGRVHRFKNPGDVDAEEYNMFVMPQGQPIAVPLPERRCGPPRSVNECKQGGWAAFSHPRAFTSQGDCIAFLQKRQ
jgi:quercetin dioxygenase-like cupin family protein